MMNIKTLPLGGAFLPGLVHRLKTLTQDDPLRMGKAIVFLPTRRACRTLTKMLLDTSACQATLLPKILSFGEGEEEDLIFFEEDEHLSLSAPLDPQLYQALLTNLVLKFWNTWGGSSQGGGIGQAANLALNLMQLLNQVETEGLSFENLETLVPSAYAEHWQITLDFLKIVTQHWPEILKAQGKVTPARLKRLLTHAMADEWAKNPPSCDIIAAGSTGSVPATAYLLKVIASLPQGEVILPGLMKLSQSEEEILPASHPQYTMYSLLKKLEVSPDKVEDLLPPTEGDAFLLKAFERGTVSMGPAQQMDHLELAECDHPQEEAGVIALKIRQTLQHPERTVLVITPDVQLTRRVTMALQRFNIVVEESAGRLFSRSPLGSLLRLTAQWCQPRLSATLLLGTLKHPLTQGPFVRSDFLLLGRILERHVLRKGKIFESLADMIGYMEVRGCPKAVQEIHWEALYEFLKDLEKVVLPLQSYGQKKNVPLRDVIQAHQGLLGFLRIGQAQAPINKIFANMKTEGEVGRSFWQNWLEASSFLILADPSEYVDLLDSFLSPLVVRAAYSQHPRISILSPMEARLMSADQIILGGLNEDSWPPSPKGDPWFSMDMREKFGLPPYQRRIGLSAHDFLEHLGSSNVLLTRSLRMDSAPTTPSRFLVKLETLLKAQGISLKCAHELIAWERNLLKPREVTAAKKPWPKPCPPVDRRPLKLSVTDITHLLHNPYDVYAKHILKLIPLGFLDPLPGALEYGIILHQVLHDVIIALDQYVTSQRRHFSVSPDKGHRDVHMTLFDGLFEKGCTLGNRLLDKYFKGGGFQEFWRVKFERSLRWFLQNEFESIEIRGRFGEISGSLSFTTPLGPFTLICKADRLDLYQDQSWRIIDYKTGILPTQKALATGRAPQLPLEAAILKFGKFNGIAPGPLKELSFMKFNGKVPAGEIVEVKGNPDEIAERAFQQLQTLVEHFLHAETPYEAGFRSLSGDYDHLARIQDVSFFGGHER